MHQLLSWARAIYHSSLLSKSQTLGQLDKRRSVPTQINHPTLHKLGKVSPLFLKIYMSHCGVQDAFSLHQTHSWAHRGREGSQASLPLRLLSQPTLPSSYSLYIGFCTLDKIATSPSVYWSYVGDEPHQSMWPKFLVVSQTFVIVYTTIFIFGSSQ